MVNSQVDVKYKFDLPEPEFDFTIQPIIKVLPEERVKLNKAIWGVAACEFGKGFFMGLSDAYVFRNPPLLTRLGFRNYYTQAWKNKWKLDADGEAKVGQERFFGSSTVFVFTTDLFHFCKFAHNRLDGLSWGVYTLGHRKKKKRIWYLVDFAIKSAAYSAGFQFSYNIILKR